ncbi:MurR/RpiR family transcriptional regulator [Cryobacterium aureum]|uniref:MurR/RpiR family transcriptional regulator n=1 Tax=Cryobacterium aureum TaxID=995037 RepID=UPI000CF57F66|nr:SIS domain-containing protein [Cryobacterium aureum]
MTTEYPVSDSHAEHKQLSSPGKRYGARLQERSLSGILQQRVIDNEKRMLEVALTHVQSDGSAIAVAGIIVAARRRFVIGTGKSFAYATLLARDLSGGLAQVYLIDETVNRSIDILSETKSTDVLIALSFRRYRRDTLELCRQFIAAGGIVVAITDESDSPITALATASICVPTDSVSSTDSPTAVAAVVHLVTTLCTASAKGAKRRLAARDDLSSQFNLYLED